MAHVSCSSNSLQGNVMHCLGLARKAAGVISTTVGSAGGLGSMHAKFKFWQHWLLIALKISTDNFLLLTKPFTYSFHYPM